MLNIENVVTHKKSKEVTHSFNVHKYKNDKISVAVSSFEDLNLENIQSFVKEHQKIVTSKYEKGKQIILGYDLSFLSKIDMKFLDTVVDQFQKFEAEYKSNVRCVFVYVQNEIVVNILNVVIKMYELTVPLILTCNEEDISECILRYGY